MSLTQISVVLLGIYLIVISQQHLSSTLTLVFGILVVLLVLLDFAPFAWPRRRVPPVA